MVLLIIIPMKNGYNWEYTLFSDKPMCLDSLQAFNMVVFALFSDMANSHDDLDSLNSYLFASFSAMLRGCYVL